MNIYERLKDFIKGETSDTEFVITTADVADLDQRDVQEMNRLIEQYRDGSKGFRVDPARSPGEALTVYKDPKLNGLYKGGKADSRVSESSSQDEDNPTYNPFRPRYRKLAQNELDHHDVIKLKAMELLDAFWDIVDVRKAAGNDSMGEEHANIKLAQRHLEDAVYRAVKALTA